MFKEHYDHMRPGPTPERVLAICRILSSNPLTEEEMKDRIYLTKTAATKFGDEWDAVKAAAELGLISFKDNVYSLSVDPNQIATVDAFRRAVATRAFSNKKSTFFRISQWYIGSNDAVFNASNWEDKAAAAVKAGIDKIRDNDMLGWRFWASFLGLGYVHGTELIPNMYIRVRDVLATEFVKSFAFEEEIPAADFFAWLLTKIPEAKMEDNTINLALSNAIRTLRDMDEVAPVALMDAVPMYLYNLPEDPTNKISHIIVKEAVCK
jgi:hypothetical protein